MQLKDLIQNVSPLKTIGDLSVEVKKLPMIPARWRKVVFLSVLKALKQMAISILKMRFKMVPWQL